MRVVVAEDSGLYRDLLVRALLDYGDIEVAGQAATTAELLDLVEQAVPDIVIIDIAMPPTASQAPEGDAGLTAARELRRRHPDLPILALSQYQEVSWAQEIATLDGPVGYQLKGRVEDMDSLVQAIRDVAHGDTRIDQTLVKALLARKRHNDPIDQLSPTERRVLELMAEGFSNTAIAAELSYARQTVEGIITSIYRKLELTALPKDQNGKPVVNGRVLAILAFLRWGRPRP
ncbi:response regulator transcription factor [Streptomyces sp. MS1.HAVA.3]|uniref:Response regulator transcription factor n=1 Tax=Streptomyces caledonius TaxID=3134107 RepID=A0ABU8UC19_9ACTN